MNTERIIDKIKKLIRHEQSARKIGNIEEAAAFAGRINELLMRHKIAAEQVSVDNEPQRPQVGEDRVKAGHYSVRYGRGYVPREDNCLMRVVAEAHFCQAIAMPGSNTILLIGADEDRAVAVEMFRFLSSTMKRLARRDKELCRRARKSVRKFNSYYYRGFTSAIIRRYEEMRETNECTALVRADALVRQYVESNYETVESAPRKNKTRINKHAYFAGVVAGRNVELGTNVIGGQ